MTLEVHELTPVGMGAVSVLLVRGSDAHGRVADLAGGRWPRLGGSILVELRDDQGLLDEALVVALDDERVEVHLHGSRPMVRRVREALSLGGPGPGPGDGAGPVADLAGPPGAEGDRTGLEAQAWGVLASAPCEAAARVLLDQAEGALRAALTDLGERAATERVAGASALAALGRRLGPLFEPARVVLAGPVNAGKSTLFNALVGGERVVVSDRPGTTRDRVLERVRLGAYAVELCDTAGERRVRGVGGAAELERRGQDQARSARAAADLVLWLVPAGGPDRPPAPKQAERRIVIISQGDRLGGIDPGRGPRVAALPDPVGARRVVEGLFLEALGLPSDPWRPGRAVPFARAQWELLERAAQAGVGELDLALEMLLAQGAPRPRPGR